MNMKVNTEVMNIDGNDGCDFDEFYAVATDSSGNIICVGVTKAEGADDWDTLLVKYDSNLNMLARKVYSGTNLDEFRGVTTDSSGNVICVGWIDSEGAGDHDALVVKYDSDLNILAKMIYGGTGTDVFHGVTIDSSDNIICTGQTTSEGAGSFDALVVKYDSDLNILAKKIYGGSGTDAFYTVATDSSDNIICAGYIHSERVDYDVALVVKFDTNLNILAKMIYDGTDWFDTVATDANDNVICVGRTDSEGAGNWDALVVKYDSNLNILAKKIYSGTDIDWFNGVAIDSNDNVICAGRTNNEGSGNRDTLVVKYDTNLNILAKKVYSATGIDRLYEVVTDANDNIICVGRTDSEGAGDYDALVVKFDTDLNLLTRKIYDGAGNY